jgi:hypothetical protein
MMKEMEGKDCQEFLKKSFGIFKQDKGENGFI